MLVAVLAPAILAAQDRGNLLVVVQDGRYGYIDHSGRIVIKPQFIWADRFWRGLGTVFVCGHYVSIDASGSILPLRRTVPELPELAQRGEKLGFVDERGRFAIPATFDDALRFSEGRAAVQIGDKWGYIDTSGQIVISPRFDRAYYFREGVAYVYLDDSLDGAIINRSGEVIASGYWLLGGIPNQGRIPVAKDDKGGYLDLEGRVVIPLTFDEVTTFYGGLAAVRRGDQWGYVDRDGRVVIPFQFDFAGDFGSGLAPVKIGRRTAYVNTSGQVVLELPVFSASSFLTQAEDSGLLSADSDVASVLTSDGKFGYVNTKGQMIWGPEEGRPDHKPLLGWDEQGIRESCQAVPETIKVAVDRMFSR